MNLTDILDFLGLPNTSAAHELIDIRSDSRKVMPGDLFIGVPGIQGDGRDYIAQALTNGARAVLIEDGYPTDLPVIRVKDLKNRVGQLADFFYQHPSSEVNVIGVTGTNGKTSITNYIAQILTSSLMPCGIMGTLGNGWLGNLTATNLTTADTCTIQKQLFDFQQKNTSYVAMEVSSHALAQQRLDSVHFTTAVFTNLTQDHLDYHKTMDEYFAAKSRLFSDFAPEHHVINIDDIYGQKLYEKYSGLTYSIEDPSADVYAQDNVVYTPWGVGLLINPLIGRFNLSNILACIGVAGLYGLDLDIILAGVQNLITVPGRMQKIVAQDAPLVVVDYAHTPDALSNVLEALHDYDAGDIYCIFGCGGDRDRGKRPLMLQTALELSDYVIITQDNPRTEDPKQILRDILSADPDNEKISVIQDRELAIQETILRAGPNDIILIAGKGHEEYQIIGAEKLPFSDVDVAESTLATRSENVWIV